MYILISAVGLVLLGCLASGLPAQKQAAVNQTVVASSNSSTLDDDDALVIRKESTRTGMLSNFIIERMVLQCSGDIDPAVEFYGCIENTTNLPKVWARMGLNATMMRLRTVDVYVFAQSNVSKEENTYVSVLQDASASNNTLLDIFNTIGNQANQLCGNVDGLLSCLNPYLASCFADSESDNDLQQSGPITNPSANRTIPNVPAASPEKTPDNDENDSFFEIPYLQSQAQVFPLLQQGFATVCSNRAAPLRGLIESVPCLFKSVDQATTSCAIVCQVTVPSVNSTVSIAPTSGMTSGSVLDPVICSIMRNCAECQLDMVTQTCGPDPAQLLHSLVQTYFSALQCFPNAGPNDNVVRASFKAGILGN